MIGVISDIHDNLANLKTALSIAEANQAEALFVLGDITNADTVKYLAKNFSKKIYLVAGNSEVCNLEAESKKYKNINFMSRNGGVININNFKIGLCHEPNLANNLIKQGAQKIFHGHTHKPWQEIKNGVEYINPGNIANTIYGASFALWNEKNDKLELKIL